MRYPKVNVKVGAKLKLEEHPLTVSHGMAGVGTVTAIIESDVDHVALVIVKTKHSYLHVKGTT